MTSRQRSSARRIAAGVIAAALLLTGCASTTDGTGSAAPAGAASTAAASSSPSGTATETQPLTTATAGPRGGLLDPASIDDSDPNAVAIAAVTTLYRWDTRTDLSPLDATQRAAAWFTPELAADATTMPTRGNAVWAELRDHDAYTSVTAELANEYGQPPNTDTRALAQVSYTVTSIGTDGWTTTSEPTVLRVRLTRAAATDPWRVSAFAA